MRIYGGNTTYTRMITNFEWLPYSRRNRWMVKMNEPQFPWPDRKKKSITNSWAINVFPMLRFNWQRINLKNFAGNLHNLCAEFTQKIARSYAFYFYIRHTVIVGLWRQSAYNKTLYHQLFACPNGKNTQSNKECWQNKNCRNFMPWQHSFGNISHFLIFDSVFDCIGVETHI